MKRSLPRDEAISAPVAVLLLIIIAVILATTLTLFGKRLTDQADDRDIPDVGFATESPDVVVVHAEEGLDWGRHLRFGGTCTPLLAGSEPAGPVLAGQRLSCEAGETLSIRSAPSWGNSLLYEAKFSAA